MFKVGDKVRCVGTVGGDVRGDFGVYGVVYTVEAVSADREAMLVQELEKWLSPSCFSYVAPDPVKDQLAEALQRLAAVLERLEERLK